MQKETKGRRSWLIVSIITIVVVGIIIVSMYYYSHLLVPAPIQSIDKFGIKKIYPTIEAGREWFINMDNPLTADNLFYGTFDRNITRQEDGSWRVNGSAVRLNVITPPGAEVWKNVEITGYAKVVGTVSSSSSASLGSDANNSNEEETDSELDWRARGGIHNSEKPCEGTAYTGTIDINGNVRWKKEIWHIGGYTDARGNDKVTTDSLLGRWIGWKVMMYNINNNTAVKLESYLDDKNNNEWTKVTDLVDKGGWYAKSSDKEFYSANCDRPKDYIITNGGPIVTFRSDGLIWDFKNLSVREIMPPIPSS
jgi:hypothetical protein